MLALLLALGAATPLQARFRDALEAQARELHLPGLAFVAVKDGEVVVLDAIGFRDVAKKLPATPDTIFPIGSCTKSFTAIAAAMSDEAGVLSLDDSPHRWLPWFRLADPEADALVTLRDMLSHRTGLKAYADLAAEPATLSREEYLRAATSAKPVAGFGTKFQYSNAIFTAAGEAAAKADGVSWEEMIRQRIFRPLAMTSSDATPFGQEGERAVGYLFRGASGEFVPVAPPRSLDALAPAGAIVSTARDLAKWLRFLASGGRGPAGPLLSEAALHDATQPLAAVDENISYALGWATYRWNGHQVVEHNGGSEGISALTSFVPERRAGFALLANASPGSLTKIGDAGKILWPILLGAAAAPASNPAPQRVPSLAELRKRMLAAAGGEKSLRRHTTVQIRAIKTYQNQGVVAEVAIAGRSPASRSEDETWTAAGKEIGRLRNFYDGSRGGQETTFGQDSTYTPEDLARARRDFALHPLLELDQLYPASRIDRAAVDGEPAWALALTPVSGTAVTLFVSARNGRILQRQSGSETTRYGDFREVDGEVVPFRAITEEPLGTVTFEVRDIRFGAALAPDAFAPR